jgi:RHS repeat-associated protein
MQNLRTVIHNKPFSHFGAFSNKCTKGKKLPLKSDTITYLFSFNGKENDNEVKGLGNQQDYGMRIHDTRLGRFLSVDPFSPEYPWYTPYQFAGNIPIWAIDLDGLEEAFATDYYNEKRGTYVRSYYLNTSPKPEDVGSGSIQFKYCDKTEERKQANEEELELIEKLKEKRPKEFVGRYISRDLDGPTKSSPIIQDVKPKLNPKINVGPKRIEGKPNVLTRANGVIWTYNDFKALGESGLYGFSYNKSMDEIKKQNGKVTGVVIKTENPNNIMNNILKYSLMAKLNLSSDQVRIESVLEIKGSTTMANPDFTISFEYEIKEKSK